MNKSNRKKASKHEDRADLISNLPDHILLVILSGLASAEELIRTSILSRRWRYMWTSIPSLDLVYNRERPNLRKEYKFFEFVDYVLSNRSADLDSFRLSCLYFSMSTVERWIQATFMRNVKRLDLTVFSWMLEDEDMVMPNCLVTCASLEELRLCFVSRRLILPTFSGFPALRVLNLKFVELFNDDLVKGFLESCPMLEDLTLDNCRVDKLGLLCISCSKPKKLRILESRLQGCLKISCPKLVLLELTGYATSISICERQYSLKEAIINLRLEDKHRLFPGISIVESLATNFNILYEFIDAAREPGLPNLKTLESTATNDVFSLDKFLRVLKHFPKLESLSLNVENEFTFMLGDPQAPEFGQMDETEAGSISTPDVKWIEFF